MMNKLLKMLRRPMALGRQMIYFSGTVTKKDLQRIKEAWLTDGPIDVHRLTAEQLAEMIKKGRAND